MGKTYANNDKVQTGPHAGKIGPKAESDPFEQHFNGEEHSKDKINNLENEHEFHVVLKNKV